MAMPMVVAIWLLPARVFVGQAPADTSAPARRAAEVETGRRQALLLLGGAAATQAEAANAFVKVSTKNEEIITAQANPKAGFRGYTFFKPAGFKRYASLIDPSGYVLRDVNDTYFTFATRSELRPNASTEFKIQDFVADYETKFVNATGSSFTLLKGGSGEPDSVDESAGVKYFKVEYIIKTQLGFSFDSLRTLHFLTTFAVASDSIYVLNCQAREEDWERGGPVLRKVTDSFKVL